uniref:Uncharacterized protein n=1 Tax=Corvus moneduloides TaxID=1196302 RepID=A0A8U7N8Z4_CORMO
VALSTAPLPFFCGSLGAGGEHQRCRALPLTTMKPPAQNQKKVSNPPSMKTAEVLNFKLNAAVKNRDKEAVLELLEQGADVNSKVDSGWTPLQTAVQTGEEDLVQLLLDRGASLHARKDNGGTAAWYGKEEALRFLYSRGAEVNLRRVTSEEKARLMLKAKRITKLL